MSELDKVLKQIVMGSYSGMIACRECGQLFRMGELIDGECWVCWSLRALRDDTQAQ